MHTQSPPSTRNYATAIAILMGIWIFSDIFQMFRNGIIITRLSPAVPGGIHLSDLTSGNVALYLIAFVLKYVLLIMATYVITRALGRMYRGEIFVDGNMKDFGRCSWLLTAWLVVRMGIEGLANNWAASTLGIAQWWDTGSGTPLSEYAPALLATFVFGAMTFVIKRGIVLEEEVDGLV